MAPTPQCGEWAVRKAPWNKYNYRTGVHEIGQQVPNKKGSHVPGLREPF